MKSYATIKKCKKLCFSENPVYHIAIRDDIIKSSDFLLG